MVESKKPGKALRIIKYVVIAVVCITLFAGYLYVYETTQIWDDDGLYYAKFPQDEGNIEVLLDFSDFDLRMYAAYNVADDPDAMASTFMRLDMDVSGYHWKKLVGNLRLYDNRLLAIRAVEPGHEMASVTLFCDSAIGYDWFMNELDMSSSVGTSWELTIDKYGDKMNFDGAVFGAVDVPPESIAYYVELLDAAEE